MWGPFALVNLGCFLRVSMQTLTDWNPAFYSVIGVSGTLEVFGLAWWGTGLIRIMRQGKREEQTARITPPRPAAIQPDHRVADVLEWFPTTEPVFVEFGFNAIKHAVFRRTLARQVSLAQACKMHSIDAQQFVAALNRSATACASAPEFVPLNVSVRAN
jgi:hypothetical protein